MEGFVVLSLLMSINPSGCAFDYCIMMSRRVEMTVVDGRSDV